MEKEVFIGLIIAASPGIIALFLYLLDMFRERFRLSIMKNIACWQGGGYDPIKGEHVDLFGISNSKQIIQVIDETNKEIMINILLDLTFSNIGRRSMTINKLIIEIDGYEKNIELDELITIHSGHSKRKKFYVYMGDVKVTDRMLNSNLTIHVTDHRGKIMKKNLGDITI